MIIIIIINDKIIDKTFYIKNSPDLLMRGSERQ